ncbi:MAG: anthranilate synthase component I family protein, partial [Selenomonadaceae bacterium]|nr:anthranilate synthase component I family protein [Selenomonadaceae bacterium]
ERPPMPQQFADMISTIQENILSGEVFQVVPSVQFKERLTRSGFEYYRRLRQVNGSPYMYYINFGEYKLCGASPEMLVKVQGRRVWTFPIAGTRPRGATPEDDARLADELLHDEKELAEHAMLVDLARNDLGRLSEPGTVRVTKLRSVEKFSHVMHLVSSVEGTLRLNYEALDVLKATFPAGTVSGAPKLRAMELINELEPVRRGSYAGVVGYMDFAGNLDMCIDLRTMRIERDRIGVIQAGAGIVADSIALNEWNEILNKAAAMRQVVREVENNGAAD